MDIFPWGDWNRQNANNEFVQNQWLVLGISIKVYELS